MKSPCTLFTACRSASGKVVKRRFVPIQISVNRAGGLINFEQKMPFDTAKLVGMLVVVDAPIAAIAPIDPDIIQ